MTQKSNHSKYWGVAVILLILAILIDQGTKYLAVTHLKDQAPFIMYFSFVTLKITEPPLEFYRINSGSSS